MSSVPPPRAPRPTAPPAGPTDQIKPVTLAGTVVEAVPGCVVLETAGGRWELAGTVPEEFAPGDAVEVTGRPAPEIEGSCGVPVMRVRQIRLHPT